MDLYKEWEKIQKDQFTYNSSSKNEIMEAISKSSSSVVNELKKRLGYKLLWIVFFILLFSGGLIWANDRPQLFPLLLIIIGFYLLGGIVLYRQYLKLKPQIEPQNNALQSMKENQQIIKSTLLYERNAGFIAFPIAILIGVMIPFVYRGDNLLEVFSNPSLLIGLLVFVIILVPAMFWLGNKMNDIAFGDYLRQLESNINDMEALD